MMSQKSGLTQALECLNRLQYPSDLTFAAGRGQNCSCGSAGQPRA